MAYESGGLCECDSFLSVLLKPLLAWPIACLLGLVKAFTRVYVPAWMLVFSKLRRSSGRVFKTTELARELGIPRTTVNQALIALSLKGLVKHSPEGYFYGGVQGVAASATVDGPCTICGSIGVEGVSLPVLDSEKRFCIKCLSRLVDLSLRLVREVGDAVSRHERREVKRWEKSANYGRFVGRLISVMRRRGRVCATSLGWRYGLSKREVWRVLEKLAPKMGWTYERTASGHVTVKTVEQGGAEALQPSPLG